MDIQVESLDFHTIKLIDETGEFVEIDLQSELGINEHNLEVEMREQPSKYLYWTSVLEKVRLFKESAELELEFLEGRLDREARVELPKMDMKPTKDSVEGFMRRNQDYQEARQKCNHYDYLVRRLNFIVKSFEQRKDLLQSYGRQIMHDEQYGHRAGRYHDKTEIDNEFIQNQYK